MEVTDLKGLKRLMKGDSSRKFEFVEEENEHHQYDEMTFSFTGGQGGQSSKRDNPGATYNTYNSSSHKGASAVDGNKYRDLSSDDSELMD
jgi:hypothetical protein